MLQCHCVIKFNTLPARICNLCMNKNNEGINNIVNTNEINVYLYHLDISKEHNVYAPYVLLSKIQ
jgi:hypothetical protein